MPKEEWGVKRVCPTTGQRFYDLKKSPIVSPYTGEVVLLDENTKTRVAIVTEAKAKVVDDDIDEDEDLLVDDDDDDAGDADLGDDLLEDDDDDNVSLDDIADVASDDDDV